MTLSYLIFDHDMTLVSMGTKLNSGHTHVQISRLYYSGLFLMIEDTLHKIQIKAMHM